MNIRETQTIIHEIAQEKGWYDDGPRNFGEQVMLIVSELSEALEHKRSGKDDHLCDKCSGAGCRKCNQSGLALTGSRISEELADVIIRVLDLAESLGYDMQDAIERKCQYNRTRPYKHGKTF
jgi:NTP pyrophosphatase (non-canonical NTP hydrolase)